jgi:hypothetical protein
MADFEAALPGGPGLLAPLSRQSLDYSQSEPDLSLPAHLRSAPPMMDIRRH